MLMGVTVICLEGLCACWELNLPRFSPPTHAVTLAIYILIYNTGEIVKNMHPPASVLCPLLLSYKGGCLSGQLRMLLLKDLSKYGRESLLKTVLFLPVPPVKARRFSAKYFLGKLERMVRGWCFYQFSTLKNSVIWLVSGFPVPGCYHCPPALFTDQTQTPYRVE